MATSIQSHVTHCHKCQAEYIGLSQKGKEAADAVYELFVLKRIKNAFKCDGEKLPQEVALNLEQRRELAQLKSTMLVPKERIKCHKLAHCTLEAHIVQLLSSLPPNS